MGVQALETLYLPHLKPCSRARHPEAESTHLTHLFSPTRPLAAALLLLTLQLAEVLQVPHLSLPARPALRGSPSSPPYSKSLAHKSAELHENSPAGLCGGLDKGREGEWPLIRKGHEKDSTYVHNGAQFDAKNLVPERNKS